jgi:hypothetical protein
MRNYHSDIFAWRMLNLTGDHRGCDRMVVGFTTTSAIIAYHH